ncbi:unnamed protein product, partial [Prorocentrum cordatum]
MAADAVPTDDHGYSSASCAVGDDAAAEVKAASLAPEETAPEEAGSRGPEGCGKSVAPTVEEVAEPLDESVVRGGEPAVEADTVSDFDVEDFLTEMFSASGGGDAVHMGDVVRKHERLRVDLELVADYMASDRFAEVFRVDGEYLFRASA